MPFADSVSDPAPQAESRSSWWMPLALALAALAVYANSFRGPFVFDDALSTVQNPTLHHWATAFFPPNQDGITVQGRPVLNLSLALNWALGGDHVAGYHALNLLIHLGCAWLLFGIVRRTLRSAPVAFTIALLWTVHPLQTESVTYIIQRAESLAALFLLGTLYCFIRQWRTGMFVCCLLGMGTKEVMYCAPFLVLLYDRTFVAGTLREAFRRHGGQLAGLFALLLWEAFLIRAAGNRGHTVGFGSGVSIWQYWATECHSICHYLRLVVWPHPLIFDYGTQWASGWLGIAPYAAVVAALVGLTVVGLRRWPAAAFLGVLFFAILAPTSIVPGNRQTSAEHRMYLPLAAVLTLAVVAFDRRRGKAPLAAAWVLALPLGLAAAARNDAYQSAMTLYTDTVRKLPNNAFARYNLGKELDEHGDKAGAIGQYQAALAIDPGFYRAADNLGNSLRDLGRTAAAEQAYENAIAIFPNDSNTRYNFGILLVQMGRKDEAMEQFNDALMLDPKNAEARDNLGGVLLDQRRPQEAAEQFLAVVMLGKATVETRYNLGVCYLLENRPAEAKTQFEEALKLDPHFRPAKDRLHQLP